MSPQTSSELERTCLCGRSVCTITFGLLGLVTSTPVKFLGADSCASHRMRRPPLASWRLMPSPMPPKPASSSWARSFMLRAWSVMAFPHSFCLWRALVSGSVAKPQAPVFRSILVYGANSAGCLLDGEAVLRFTDQRQIHVSRRHGDALRHDAQGHHFVDLALHRRDIGPAVRIAVDVRLGEDEVQILARLFGHGLGDRDRLVVVGGIEEPAHRAQVILEEID